MGHGNRPILTETRAVPAKAQAVLCCNRVPEEEVAQRLYADLLWAPPNTVFSCWAFTWGKISSTGQSEEKRVTVSGFLRVILCPWRTRAPLPADSHCLWGGWSASSVGVWWEGVLSALSPLAWDSPWGGPGGRLLLGALGHLPPLCVLGWLRWPGQEDKCQCLLSGLQSSRSFPRL